jgi:hypothetical protein
MCGGLMLRAALKRNGSLLILGKDLATARVIGKGKAKQPKAAKPRKKRSDAGKLRSKKPYVNEEADALAHAA